MSAFCATLAGSIRDLIVSCHQPDCYFEMIPLAIVCYTVLPCRPAVLDTPELRSQYIREILLSAFELDRSL